jgi:hypothetical protein
MDWLIDHLPYLFSDLLPDLSFYHTLEDWFDLPIDLRTGLMPDLPINFSSQAFHRLVA